VWRHLRERAPTHFADRAICASGRTDDESRKRLRRAQSWLLATGSVLVLLLVGGIAEVAVRLFSAVDLLVHRKTVRRQPPTGRATARLQRERARSERSSTRRARSVPKGGVPRTRINPSDPHPRGFRRVRTGVGIGDVAGRLRRDPDQAIYNSSVIGYSTNDYRNVVEAFCPPPGVTAVALSTAQRCQLRQCPAHRPIT